MKIQLRNDTAANWTAANPVLAAGEFGTENDTDLFKKGDGITAWNDLAYANGGGGSGGITQTQADARYIQKTAINAASGVPGLDASKFMDETQLPLPPVTLTILLANKLA